MLGNGKSRSGHACAFVVYFTLESANLAIRSLDGTEYLKSQYLGIPMQVRFARSNPSIQQQVLSPFTTLSTCIKKRWYSYVNARVTDSYTSTSTEASSNSDFMSSEGYVEFFAGCLPLLEKTPRLSLHSRERVSDPPRYSQRECSSV
jgi:hypothetical protein